MSIIEREDFIYILQWLRGSVASIYTLVQLTHRYCGAKVSCNFSEHTRCSSLKMRHDRSFSIEAETDLREGTWLLKIRCT